MRELLITLANVGVGFTIGTVAVHLDRMWIFGLLLPWAGFLIWVRGR